ILYTFGDGYVTPLVVERRSEAYRGDLVGDEAIRPPTQVADADDLLASETGPTGGRRAVAPAADAGLPRDLSPELLTHLHIDREHHGCLGACRTLDDLCAAPVPSAVRDRVWDAIMDPDLDRILEEPEFVVGNIEDLRRYVEGELVGFLLRLDPEQEAVVGRG